MLEIKVGGVEEHFNLPWHLLRESNRLPQQGIDLQWMECPGGTGEMTERLRFGELDLAVLLTEGMIMDIIKGSSSRIFKVFVQSSLIWGVHVGHEAKVDLQSDQELRFAISREGSGSHLMALVYAKEHGISPDRIDFKIVGSLEGALKAFQESEVDVFLWEKFTTDPHCLPGMLKRIDTIPTPWPCFVIAVNDVFYDKHASQVASTVYEVLKQAAELKQDPRAVNLVAERYGLQYEESAKWFASVEWGDGRNLAAEEISKVVKELTLLGKLDVGIHAEPSLMLI